MEEDVGVPVIVTRLRRRRSVEQSEDVSSPSTPSKKRVGRLAAKPQLELIDENVQVSSPRKTKRKSIAKDVADEEKPVTPSRRSTRIKSNTSIISETLSIQATDSPRARRALRRNSAAGSDNEGPATPARQTKRTRKDSASSVENQEPAALNRPKVVEMVIAEEPEIEIQKSEKETVVKKSKSKSSPISAVEELSPNSARKSKRLLEKRKSGSNISDHDSSVTAIENKSLNISAKGEISKVNAEKKLSNRLNKSAESNEISETLSDSNLCLLKTINTESIEKKSKHNKSVSALDSEQNGKKKRNRTKSWPALLTTPPAKENIAFSDNEQAKKKKRNSANIQSFLNKSSSGLNRSSSKEDNTNTTNNEKDTSQIFIDSPSKRKKRPSETSSTKDVNQPSENVKPTEEQTPIENISSNIEKTVKPSENNDIASEMEMFFENPHATVQAIVYFEDSDSNSINTKTAKKIQELAIEDQCVPVIKHDIEYQDKLSSKPYKSMSNSQKIGFLSQSVSDMEPGHDISSSNKAQDDVDNSCEPMDIDETIHEDILQKSQNTLQESATERKSLTLPQGSSNMDETNKSKRKSSISARDTPDRSSNENKSTLILSQIKDVSATSENTQSPKPATNELSNSNTVNVNDNKVSKTNLSSNDLKETPLRPKNVTNLTMQTSTPITTAKLENKTKVEQKNYSPEKSHSNLSKSIDESQSSDEDSDERSENKRKLLDDEAEEASDDYESGDSRDEEEKHYEKEHEIVERGETLDSDDEVSNDSDYEKDSFVVSSDAEDNDLLSGSGDDLSNSDNELSMSKKSKKKYNERKLKEQKVASREMFESRHKLNDSDQKSPAPKHKNNRMRIDSSLLESDEEVVVKSKKNNRLRLDSTLDTSAKQDTNESLNKSKTTSNKSLQESICNENANDEKEITLCDESISHADPLQVHFKQELKTPQKDLNISVVQFTDRQDIENVEVGESNSILDQTNTDPLQPTMVCGDTSDSSESEEIMQNYDSILSELNKNKKAKLGNNNVSLNMAKKPKNKNDTIIDQLNLTNTKTPNKNKKAQSMDVVDSKTIESSKKTQDSDIESSNSIDLKLLFSEDNCGSEDEHTTNKNEQQNNKDEEEMFLPLRKSTGKTNICESKDMDMSQQNLSLTESSKEKKKRKTSVVINEFTAEPKDPNESEQGENAPNASLKKKNRKSSLVPSESVEEPLDAIKSESLTSQNKSSKKEKKRKSSIMAIEPADECHDPNQGDENVSVPNKSSSKKKKQRASLSATGLEEESRDVNESIDALLNESSSKKKRNTNTSVVEEPQDVPEDELVFNESIKKKKKRKSSLGTVEVAHSEGDLFFIDTTGARVSETDDNADLDKTPVQVLYVKEKKKKNKKIHGSQNIIPTNDHMVEESNVRLTPETRKKKKKSHELESSVFCDDDSDGAPEEVLYRSEKASNQENELQYTESVTKSVETDGSKKKKKKKKKLSTASDQSVENPTITENSSIQNSKKRKRKSSDTGGVQGSVKQAAQEAEEHRTQNESLSVGSLKKKRKISYNNEVTAQTNAEADNVAETEKKSKKKKHKKSHELNSQNTAPEPEVNPVQVKKNKKRKERDEDSDSKKTKVSKENSFQEVHKIPLLPASIISQLEDKPRTFSEKPKVISTSKFVVETARQKRAKPSNYLEESIYLNADSPVAKQEKSRITKPKVLPFVPTASISGSGYTTTFKINKVSQNVQFAAEPGITFSKEKYLQKKEIKRLGTYDLYKKQINKKLSKF